MLRHARRCIAPVEQNLRYYLRSSGHIVRTISSSSVSRSNLAKTVEDETPSSKPSEREVAESVEHGRALRRAYQHPRTHNIPVALIHFRSHFPHLLELATHFATHAAAALAIPCSRQAYLPTRRTLWTVLRGPFAHKKSQENFERRVHRRAIKAWDADGKAVDRWLTYLQLHPVEGVGMRVVRWHRAPVGIGRLHQPDVSGDVTNKQKVEELATKIIEREMAAAGLSNVHNKVSSREK